MREAAASIVVGSFESQKPSKDELRFFAKEKTPGFVLFKRNISQDNFELLPKNLIDPLYKARNEKTPLFVAVDQEGGRVRRLSSPFPNLGAPLRIDNTSAKDHQETLLFEYGITLAKALLDLHINVNFAPVVDILSNPLNVGIGDRAFGVHAEQVVSRAGSFLKGMQSVGLWGCLKHFPGQGSELSDPHHEKVVAPISLETLTHRELVPYKKLLSLVPMVMVSHCIYPCLDSKPASLSPKIISELLRKQLAYEGLILTDDMNMKAISQDKELWQNAIVSAIAAGSNLVLVCSGLDNWNYAIEALEREGRRSEAFANMLYISAEKVFKFRKNQLASYDSTT